MASDFIRIAIDPDVISEVMETAEVAAHQKMPYGRAVAYLLGEYKRMKAAEDAALVPAITAPLPARNGKTPKAA